METWRNLQRRWWVGTEGGERVRQDATRRLRCRACEQRQHQMSRQQPPPTPLPAHPHPCCSVWHRLNEYWWYSLLLLLLLLFPYCFSVLTLLLPLDAAGTGWCWKEDVHAFTIMRLSPFPLTTATILALLQFLLFSFEEYTLMLSCIAIVQLRLTFSHGAHHEKTRAHGLLRRVSFEEFNKSCYYTGNKPETTWIWIENQSWVSH